MYESAAVGVTFVLCVIPMWLCWGLLNLLFTTALVANVFQSVYLHELLIYPTIPTAIVVVISWILYLFLSYIGYKRI